jgi:putative ABC transport system permease protein
MQLWARLKSLVCNLLRKQQVENRLQDEVRAYAEMLADEKIAAGMPAQEARRTTLADLGGIEQVKQSVRDRRTGAQLELLWQDVRYAVRQLNRNRAFTLTAVITLALGIGATTAIFSAVYALLLRPLPYPEPDRLVYISPLNSTYQMPAMLSQDFVAAQTATKSFEQYAGYYNWIENLTGAVEPTRINRAMVTANLLPTLGALPQLGRLFTHEEDRPGGPAVVILSDHLWRNHFHADPAIVGKSIALNGKLQTIIGVLSRSFRFPDLTLEPDVYTPADLDRNTTLAVDRPSYSIRTIARLSHGVSRDQAEAELQTFFIARDRKAPPEFAYYLAGRKMIVDPLQRYIGGDDRKPLFILLACVGAVLLIACANVANLQLARAVSRRHETALRGALGASRMRLIRQFLVESLILSSIAAACGLVIACVVTALVRQAGTLDTSQPASRIPQLLQPSLGKLSATVHVDAWVFAFTIALALLTTLLFGLAPAITGTRLDLRNALQSAAMRLTQAREQRVLRHGLLVVEVALAVVLLASAGLLVRSFVNVMHYDSGFDPSNTLTGVTLLEGSHYDARAQTVRAFTDNLLPRLQSLPGVQSAAIASAIPLSRTDATPITFGPPSPAPPYGAWKTASIISITPDYFRVVGNPIVQGRSFIATDTATSLPVAIVNEAFAQHYYGGNALGRKFNRITGRHQFTSVIIVGIAENVRHNALEQSPEPEAYVPNAQAPADEIYISLRSTADPALLANAMRKAVLAVDPQQPLFDIQTMDQRVSDQVAQRRLIMLLIACFAALAVILSAVGVYGVFAYSVSQRTQEMGIRLALGASRSGLLGLVVAQAARLIALGGVLGIAAAFLLSKLLTSMLVGVKPHDAMSFSLAWILMTIVALLASTIPASHAARTDLVSVLHSE